ncbi:hypothetical protein KRIGEM_03049 (plasmid) [Komagataeibacter rhaeticus]|nr:hypothetical protein KRIGEM_03049 [Komagataeibacter rhaeticus]
MDTLASKGLTELAFQHVVDGTDDEIHHLNRRVDNTQAVLQAWEGFLEKAVIQFLDNLLATIGRINARSPFTHAGIESLQPVRFLMQAVLVQSIQNRLHGSGHGVVANEAMASEQGFEHGAGDEMLCQHLDDFVLADAVVQFRSQV